MKLFHCCFDGESFRHIVKPAPGRVYAHFMHWRHWQRSTRNLRPWQWCSGTRTRTHVHVIPLDVLTAQVRQLRHFFSSVGSEVTDFESIDSVQSILAAAHGSILNTSRTGIGLCQGFGDHVNCEWMMCECRRLTSTRRSHKSIEQLPVTTYLVGSHIPHKSKLLWMNKLNNVRGVWANLLLLRTNIESAEYGIRLTNRFRHRTQLAAYRIMG